MRILMVSNYFPEHIGGVETVADNLARGYRARGHRVRWLAAQPRQTPHHGHPDDVPLACWNLTEDRLGFPYPIPGPISWLRLIREVAGCDVVHVHDCLYLVSVTATLVARAYRKRVLLTQHVGPVPYRSPVLRWLQRLAYATLGRLVLGQSTRIVFVSQSVADWFAGDVSPSKRATVVANGVDGAIFGPVDADRRQELRRELGLPQSSPVLMFSGRFVEKKGLRLIREVAVAEPGWSWTLIGRPGDIDPRSWHLENVHVLPPMSQARLAAYYAAADLFVLPSVGEGFPVAVQEAMACGTPAVVSDEVRSNVPEAPLFSAARNGQAIRAAIATALTSLTAGPNLRDRVATYTRERWDWNSVVGLYADALTSLLIAPTLPSPKGGGNIIVPTLPSPREGGILGRFRPGAI